MPRRLIAAVVFLAGCGLDVVDLLPGPSVSDGSLAKPDLFAADLAMGDLAVPDFALGPDLYVPPGGQVRFGADCASSLAAQALRQALCTCSTLSPGAPLTTMPIDSSGGNVDPSRSAAVASNRSVAINAPFSVSGALVLIDRLTSIDLGLNVSSLVKQSLRVEGDVQLVSRLHVLGDATIGGTISGPLVLEGNYHIPVGAPCPPGQSGCNRDGGGGDDNLVLRDYAPLASPPCDCSPASIPIAATLADRALANDDGYIGLGVDDLAAVGVARQLDLPAGQFYVSAISTTAALTLSVHGPAALFVGGAVNLGGALDVLLDPGASLDLVFGGDLTAAAHLGSYDPTPSSEQPARVRLWSAAATTLGFPQNVTVSAAIHTPLAQLSAPAGLTLNGSLLVDSVALGGPGLAINFDRALLSIGNRTCGTPVVSSLR